MIEIIIGLGATVAILIVSSIYLLKKNTKLKMERDAMKEGLDSINEVHEVLDEITKQQEEEIEDNNESISNRNYFGD